MKLQLIVIPVADVDRAKPPANRCLDEIAWRSLMRVRARRFLRWATPLPPVTKQRFSVAGIWFKEGCDDYESKRSARRSNRED